MSAYENYLKDIEIRKTEGLNPKPIEDSQTVIELISHIKQNNAHKKDCLDHLIYNTLPGTTGAAKEKAKFLKEIILGSLQISEIDNKFAFELLSHMKGGPSIEVLIDLALGDNENTAQQSSNILKSQVFLYDADIERLKQAYENGNKIATDILQSYANAEFFTNLPDVEEEIDVVTFIAAEGDISTDLLSPGNQAHSRADRELHGKCFISDEAQSKILELKNKYPDKRIMLIAEKGTMGVGSSRMSGVNNVALWTGKKASPYVPFVNFAPIVAGSYGISPIFQTTVEVTGGIGINLKNWIKALDNNGNPILNNDGNPVLTQTYSVDTGTVLKINTKTKKLYDETGQKELVDISSSFTQQNLDFIRAGGSYAVVFGKKLQNLACQILKISLNSPYAKTNIVSIPNQGMTAVEKIFNANAIGVDDKINLHAGSDVRVKVNIVGSQDTTGPMTVQELEAMAATIIAPIIDGAY